MGEFLAWGHVSRCNKGHPGRQGADGHADPISGAARRARPGPPRRHRGPRPVPPHLSPARMGTDRTQAHEPAELREFAGLDRHGMLIGQGNRFELWDESRWSERRDLWLKSEEAATDLPS